MPIFASEINLNSFFNQLELAYQGKKYDEKQISNLHLKQTRTTTRIKDSSKSKEDIFYYVNLPSNYFNVENIEPKFLTDNGYKYFGSTINGRDLDITLTLKAPVNEVKSKKAIPVIEKIAKRYGFPKYIPRGYIDEELPYGDTGCFVMFIELKSFEACRLVIMNKDKNSIHKFLFYIQDFSIKPVMLEIEAANGDAGKLAKELFKNYKNILQVKRNTINGSKSLVLRDYLTKELNMKKHPLTWENIKKSKGRN